jgi:glutamate-1-semialdehyde 2,1-aminomutase
MNRLLALGKISSLFPGGVDGNAKYFEGMPVIGRASGSRLFDIEGNEYIDYCCGYGPLIFGHNDREITAAIADAVKASGMIYGLPHPGMYEAGALVCECVPCAEMIRFTNSGTEATLSCIRLARAFTKRDKIVKFYGAYHGTHESVLIGTRASEPAPDYPYVGVNSAGLPQGVVQDTYVLPFNDADFAKTFIETRGDEIAAVLIEPVLGSYGLAAEKTFLEALRRLTDQHEIVLVFDEVVTGFRLALGGIQELFGVIPDLVALGKAMGGGYPIGAFAGRREIMERVAPTGNPFYDSENVVYHSGTYNSNPVAMMAVKTTLEKLRRENIYPLIDGHGDAIRRGLRESMASHGFEGIATGIGSLVQCHFGVSGNIRRPEELAGRDLSLQKRFHSLLLKNGILFNPGPRGYISAAHTHPDVGRTLEAINRSFQVL